jgi:hypothetical protein
MINIDFLKKIINKHKLIPLISIYDDIKLIYENGANIDMNNIIKCYENREKDGININGSTVKYKENYTILYVNMVLKIIFLK